MFKIIVFSLALSLTAALASNNVFARTFKTSVKVSAGTYELIEGSFLQFDARENKNSGKITRYQWRILEGMGAKLDNADGPKVTFHAPMIKFDQKTYRLQLQMDYANGKPSTADVYVRVHKKSAIDTHKRKSPWLTGNIRFGFGYLWGAWWPHPPIIILPCPPPETVWPPESFPPIAVPMREDPSYNNWAEAHPAIVENYLQEDPNAAQPPVMEQLDSHNLDAIDLPDSQETQSILIEDLGSDSDTIDDDFDNAIDTDIDF